MNTKHLLTHGVGLFALAVFNSGCHNGIHKPGTGRAVVEVAHVVIDDSEGNKDGTMNPGEIIKMRFQFKNAGKEKISSSRARLFTSQNAIHIRDKVVQIPSLPPGESAYSTNAVVLSIDENATETNAAFYLEGANIRATFSGEIQPTAQQDTVMVENFVIIDTTDIDGTTHGNGDGQLNPGEKVKLLPQLKNTGEASLPATIATLSTSQFGIDIIDSTASYPPIDTGKSVFPVSGDFFIFEASTGLSVPVVKFILIGKDGLLTKYEEEIDITLPIRIYACIDTCIITRNNYPGEPNPDELLLRLYVCNDTGGLLSSVAAKILASEVGLCDVAVPFVAATTTSEKVYYGNINDNECGPPNTECRQFIYRTDLSAVSGFHCIRFYGHIYIDVEPPNCNWTFGTPNEIKLGYRIEF